MPACLRGRSICRVSSTFTGAGKTRTLVIDDFQDGSDGWVTSSPATDPVPPVPSLLKSVVGPEGVRAITVTRPIAITTHKVGDPKWRGPRGASLEFRVHSRSPRTLRVVMHEKEFAIGWTQYTVVIPLEPGEGWRTITLAPEVFTTEQGKPLGGWDQVQQLELKTSGGAGEEPLYGSLRWKVHR